MQRMRPKRYKTKIAIELEQKKLDFPQYRWAHSDGICLQSNSSP
ncbi:MAG: hypothetical protein ACRD8Z_13455 [Nitrososphaeraceae archaeon]